MKKSLLVGVSLIILAACSNNEVIRKEKAEDMSTTEKVEKTSNVVVGREYTVTAIKGGVLSLEESTQDKKENPAQINRDDIIETTWTNYKRNGLIDISDHVSFEAVENNQYRAIIVKDVIGETKYDGTIRYEIIEVTDKAIKWLPLNDENNGGYVPPEMIMVVNGNNVKVGNIVTIKESEKFELTIQD